MGTHDLAFYTKEEDMWCDRLMDWGLEKLESVFKKWL